ncbi:hypothetical protein FQR65_LT09590 [Abscondita terminalis]|nr:hypothetical protein FQR65_LT09590 [Abscondita terminalis]
MSTSQNKCCFVPGCKNTSISAPQKLFLSVPKDYSRKVKWFKAARRDVPKSKSMFFCCEDHFKLEEDMENYIRHKLIGGKIILKSGVIPHLFDCQPDRKRAASASDRLLPLKRKRILLIEEALTSSECSPVGPHQPSTSSVDEHVVADKHKEEVVKSKDIGVLVKPSFRSRYVMCNIQTEKCDTASSPGTFLKPTDVATSPIKSTLITAKKSLSIKKKLFSHPSTSSGNDEFESTSSYIPNSDTDFAESEFESVEEKKYKQEQTLKVTQDKILTRLSKIYTIFTLDCLDKDWPTPVETSA